MDEKANNTRWALHIKHVLGEPLTPSERAIIEEGGRKFDAKEIERLKHFGIDEITYKAWQPLHIRMAMGKTLTPKEDQFCQVVQMKLDAAEALQYAPTARRLEQEIQMLQQENARLHALRQQLDEELAILQARLNELQQR